MKQLTNEKFRYEVKYVCSDLQLVQMQERMDLIMQKDPHVNARGFYTIRSLYFDDYADRAFWEKEDGTDPREKYRIRFYDGRTASVSLEIKRKVRGKTQTESARITKKEAEEMMQGHWFPDTGNGSAVVQKAGLNGMLHLLSPKIIVESGHIPR